MKCTIMGYDPRQQGSSNKRALSNKEGSDKRIQSSAFCPKPFLKIVFFFGCNFQIDLNMSCDGAKEEIKNLLDYNKYEDYVDTFICPTDLKFLQV